MNNRRGLAVLFVIVLVAGLVVGYTTLRDKPDNTAPKLDNSPGATSQPRYQTDGEVTYLEGDAYTGAIPKALANWREGLTLVTATENALFAQPNPARVGDFATADCPCNSEAVGLLTNLRDKKWRVAGDNLEITGASLLKVSADKRQVEAMISIETKGHDTIDANGNTIETGPSGLLPPFRYILEKGSDDRWRIADRAPLTATEGA